MTELLSRDDYAATAAEMDLPSTAYINGKFVKAKSAKTFETINPATGEVLTKVSACGAADVDYAVKKARQAFDAGVWSRMHPAERKSAMIQWVKLMRRHHRELAVMESIDSGKPIRDCVNIDLAETEHCLAWYAEAADKMYGQIAPTSDDAMGLIVREPSGVVACVLPWNFPLMMLGWKAGPALAAGNSVIVKPASQTSLTALRMAELATEAGIPAGVFNVIPGPGGEVGSAIGLHPDIDAVSFTGSTEIGRMFLKYAADSNLKKVTLELGGKNPAVVLSDAENLDSVAEYVVQAVFWNMGENCTSNSRLIVHKSLKADLLERVLAKVADWRTGDPLDPANALGAMVSRSHYEQVLNYIKIGKKEGGKLVLGGAPLKLGKGLYIPPVIFDGVTPKMTIAREEIFGPVLAVMTVGSDEEAIALGNDTCYGLQASVFSGNIRKALRAGRDLRAGTVSVNCYSEGDITTPFGGYKLSGFGGRDKSLLALEQYTETKTIWIDLSDHPIDAEA
jgi:4-(gamma-glutamylamino)butanal dehydrogenase